VSPESEDRRARREEIGALRGGVENREREREREREKLGERDREIERDFGKVICRSFIRINLG